MMAIMGGVSISEEGSDFLKQPEIRSQTIDARESSLSIDVQDESSPASQEGQHEIALPSQSSEQHLLSPLFMGSIPVSASHHIDASTLQHHSQILTTASDSNHHFSSTTTNFPDGHNKSTYEMYVEAQRRVKGSRMKDSADSGLDNGGGRARRHWTADEEKALLDGLDEVKGSQWSLILSLYGKNGKYSEVLKGRNQVQLKDKARNLKLWFQKNTSSIPLALRLVTGDLGKRGPNSGTGLNGQARKTTLNGSSQFQAPSSSHLVGVTAFHKVLETNYKHRYTATMDSETPPLDATSVGEEEEVSHEQEGLDVVGLEDQDFRALADNAAQEALRSIQINGIPFEVNHASGEQEGTTQSPAMFFDNEHQFGHHQETNGFGESHQL